MAMKSGFGVELGGLEKLKRQLKSMDRRLGPELTLTAGWDENSRYPDGRYTADIALIQEYGAIVPAPSGSGTVSIPSRPFIRPCIAQNEAKWDAIVSQAVRQATTDESLTGEKILLRVATTMVTDLKAAINAVTDPPLSPYTISHRMARHSYSPEALAAGYSTKPLIDTGHMFRSITYFVRPGIPGEDS